MESKESWELFGGGGYSGVGVYMLPWMSEMGVVVVGVGVGCGAGCRV